MAVRKTKAGANLKRWFKEKWTDQKGNPCGSNKTTAFMGIYGKNIKSATC